MFLGGLGAPDSVTAVTGSPTRLAPSSSGLPTVADERIKTGCEPYRLQIRLSRRMTQAMWEPNTPR